MKRDAGRFVFPPVFLPLLDFSIILIVYAQSSQECWTQADECWGTYLPTGNKNCQIWQDKCTEIDTQCSAGNWNGPPNKGKVLTPELEGVGGSMKVFSGGVSSADSEGSGSGSGIDEAETETSTSQGVALTSTPAAETAVAADATGAATATTASAEDVEATTAAEAAATSGAGRPGRGHGHGRGRKHGRCKAKRSH